MQPNWLSYAEQPAPRYTSYPTAPHFSPALGEAQVRDWLGALSGGDTLAAYIHVPYCRDLCWYCGCNTYAARKSEPVRSYVDLLLQEIDLVASACGAARMLEIQWGGGTPNILSPEQFCRVLERLHARFDASGIAHHAIEIDPRHIDKAKAAAYAACGVNRASLGVQDLNDHVQAAIGRVQPVDVVQRALDHLREAGVAAINVDLMYGLPHQLVDDLLRTIGTVVRMQPDRIALFGYAHVPWFKKRQRLISEAALPGAAERFAQAEAARTALEAAGYVAIGIDHFARARDELAQAASAAALTRSFQGYVVEHADALIGFGASAISTYPQGYAQNLPEPGAWGRAVAEGRLPVARGHALQGDDDVRRRLIMQIMCDLSGDLSPMGGAAACRAEIAALHPMIEDGFVAIDGDKILVSEAGRPFCRLVARAFDAYVGGAPARHSRAV
jgi:oxygen-independent coproporphyrinogen-3 oxidase